jgi:hypothetical protein
MSATDDIKSEIAAINAKVDRLIAGIPERHLQYLNHPDDAALKIETLEKEVAEASEIKSALDALNAKLDSAIADNSRYAKVPGDIDIHASTPGRQCRPAAPTRDVAKRVTEELARPEQSGAYPRRRSGPRCTDGARMG